MGVTRAARVAGAVLSLVALAAAVRPVAAQPRPTRPVAEPPVPTGVRAGRDTLERVRAERAALAARLQALQSTAHDLREEVTNLDRQADATARLVTALDRQLARIAGEEQDAAARLAVAQTELTRQQVGLRRRLVDIYKRGPLYEAEALLSAASFGDLVARYKYLHELARRDRVLVRRVERLRDDVAARRAVLVRLQGELARNRDDRAAEEARLRAFGSRGAEALATVERQREGARRRLAELARSEARIEGLLASFEAARRRAEARTAAAAVTPRPARPATGVRAAAVNAAPVVPTAPARTDGAGRLEAGRLDWPARGGLLYRFGRVAGANNTTTRWNGIGISAPAGAAVRAAAAGQVVLVQAIGTYGLTVIVQHGGGDYSVYGSLQRADVRVGDAAARGQLLGTVGATDPDLPAHLHFEVRPGGRAVDPLLLLR
jgi:septal ring factor EnvC (AmiA/AmiB activator)